MRSNAINRLLSMATEQFLLRKDTYVLIIDLWGCLDSPSADREKAQELREKILTHRPMGKSERFFEMAAEAYHQTAASTGAYPRRLLGKLNYVEHRLAEG